MVLYFLLIFASSAVASGLDWKCTRISEKVPKLCTNSDELMIKQNPSGSHFKLFNPLLQFLTVTLRTTGPKQSGTIFPIIPFSAQCRLIKGLPRRSRGAKALVTHPWHVKKYLHLYLTQQERTQILGWGPTKNSPSPTHVNFEHLSKLKKLCEKIICMSLPLGERHSFPYQLF